MSSKYIGFGSYIQCDPAGGTSYTTIAGVRSISRSEATSNDVETTIINDATRFESFIGGLVNPGEVDFELAYDPATATHKSLALLLSTQAIATWKIVYSDTGATAETFSGYVKSLGNEVPLRELMTRKVKVKVTGNPGFATA